MADAEDPEMPDFERHMMVAVDPDTAFDYVADPSHLPEFVSMLKEARHEPGRQRTEIHVAAEVNGRREEGDTRFRADRWSRSIDWGDPPDYRGTMRIEAAEARRCRISLLLRVRDPRGEGSLIEQAMDETMASLAARLTESE
jgi:ribosome-associated toxin RatA of RatAB toxin-antitoxin module